jgi:hypothetical protein
MKRIISILSVFLLASCIPALAQKFSITNTDPANYPQIVVNVSLQDDAEEAIQADFKVLEEGKEVPFTFSKDAGETGGGAKAICFLIEASGFTYGTPIENFKKAITSAINILGDKDKINVCYFGKANSDGRSLNTLSAEFTNDKSTLINELKSKVVAVRDTNRSADVFKSIYECLDFINSKQDLPPTKILIVISAAINNSKSPIKADDCIDRANKYSIPVYTVTYKTGNRYAADNFVRISDQTNGKSESAKTSDEISTAINDFVTAADKNSVAPSNSYTIEFATTQGGELINFEIQYKGEKQNGSFTVPADKISFWNKFMIWIIIGIVLFLLIATLIVWFILKGKKKSSAENDRLRAAEERNIQLQQQLNQSKEVKTQVTPKEPQKFDLKKTQIGGGGGTPMLMISAGNFSKNFPLNKPQITIGRVEGNDIVVPEQTVSSKHATVVNEGGNWFIVDNNSTNGTFVNGTRINKQRITPSDVIKLGAAFLKIQF